MRKRDGDVSNTVGKCLTRLARGRSGKRKRQKIGVKQLESLPTELARYVLEYADVPSLLTLAGCSKYWEGFIYVQSTWLWVEVDFGLLPTSCAARLCDVSLRRFLERINAREVTKVLSLRGCTGVTGIGLDALRCSQILEEVELRVGGDHDVTVGETGLDDRAVLGVLSTMVPGPRCTRSRPVTLATARLSFVRFRHQLDSSNIYASHSYDIAGWLYNFHQQLQKGIKANRTMCGHCDSVLAEKIPKEDFVGEFLCVSCRRYSCAQNPSPFVQECYTCMGQYCDDCRRAMCCAKCDHFFCDECRLVEICEACDKWMCEECGDMKICEKCENWFCQECGDVEICSLCSHSFCAECREVTFCDQCDSRHCKECG